MTSELQWLYTTLLATLLMAFPYVLNRIAVRGLFGALANPSPDDKPLSAWAARAQRAHANAVENLVVFAPAVLLLTDMEKGTAMTGAAALVYFVSRLVHYVVYTLGIPGIRTLAFFGGWGATAVILLQAGGLI